MLLNGSQIILETLIEQGVDTVFGYPGGAVLNIYDALYDYSDRITHILTSHEQNAAHAADGYARTTGKTGVVFATSGPGATNLVTGIATAYMDSVPIVAITGNVTTSLLGLDSFQEVDITGITLPITKHNFIVKDVTKLADIIREAFFIANDGRKGPVLIDIPKDITAAVCEFENRPVMGHTFTLDIEEVSKAAEIIAKAERPFIYAGGGVVSAGAETAMKRFADLIDAPVSLSLMGQCAMDNTDPRFVGMLGMHGTKTAAEALTHCDVMIVVGSRFSDRVTCNTDSFAENTSNCKIIHIEVDPAEIGKNVAPDVHVTGDAQLILNELAKTLSKQSHPQWNEQIAEWKKEYALFQTSDDEEAVLPQYVIETLCEMTEGRAIISTEVGQHQMWAAQYNKAEAPRTFISSGGMGTMGFGMGAAIGAQMAHPDKRVVLVTGDGSFHMNLNELVTLKSYDLPVVVVIMNNSVLGMVRQWQKLFYGNRFSQTDPHRATDFVALANAFGVDGMRITKEDEVKPTLEKAFALNKPVVVECVISPDENVLPMIPPGKTVDDIITSM